MDTWTKTAPMAHQSEALHHIHARGTSRFALFMEQGTGKTKVALDVAAEKFAAGQLDVLLVVAPNGVHRNWIEQELPKHLGVTHHAIVWSPSQTKKNQRLLADFMKASPGTLRVVAMNVEAFSHDKGIKFAARLLRSARAMMVVDESSTIKTPTAKRTRNLVKVGKLAGYRMILTGTPVTQGPLDLYAQCQFLADGLLGFTTFTTFKAYYAEWIERQTMSGHKFKELVRYKNIEELKRRVASFSYSVRKHDCLDLPPKVYELRPVEMDSYTARLYKEVKTNIVTWIRESESVTIQHVFTRLIRLQQITGGFITWDDKSEPQPICTTNSKLESLLTLVDELAVDSQVIIWARFVHELRMINEALSQRGHKTARWWGEIPEKVRAVEKDEFQSGSRRFFIGQPHSGGYGLTLTAADTVIYFSNDFSLEARLQSEDRAHRIGQHKSVTYHDLVMTGTIDSKVLKVLKAKRDVADYFMDVKDIARWLDE